jgi:hypothetical protein
LQRLGLAPELIGNLGASPKMALKRKDYFITGSTQDTSVYLFHRIAVVSLPIYHSITLMKNILISTKRLLTFSLIPTIAGLLLSCYDTGYHNKLFEIKDGPLTVHIALCSISAGRNYLTSHSYKEGMPVDSSRWDLPYPVYHFEIGDVDGNGTKDIAVGIIKTARYDSIARKRIFLFQLQEGSIIPLWLGSRVSQPLQEFALFPVSEKSNVRTIELEQDGSYLVAEYEWYGFGLSFVRYIMRNSGLGKARRALKNSAWYMF